MKILLTGASGFIGSHTLKALIQSGHQVAALSRAPLQTDPAISDQLTLLSGRFDNPPWQAIADFGPDSCVHSAWITTPGLYLDSEENDLLAINSKTFLLKLEQMGVSNFTVLGTCFEYDLSGSSPLSEKNTSTLPRHRYSQAKVHLFEELQRCLSSATSLTWARVFYPYGKGEAPEKLVSHLVSQACQGAPMELKKPGNVMDYIHVKDVASALALITEKSPRGIINVGTGHGISAFALSEEVGRQLNCPELIQPPENNSLKDSVSIVADNSKLKSLPWSPKITLQAGIQDLIQDFCGK